MSGQWVREKIMATGIPLAAVARRLGITPQSLHERLGVRDVKVSVLVEIAESIDKDLLTSLMTSGRPRRMGKKNQLLETHPAGKKRFGGQPGWSSPSRLRMRSSTRSGKQSARTNGFWLI